MGRHRRYHATPTVSFAPVLEFYPRRGLASPLMICGLSELSCNILDLKLLAPTDSSTKIDAYVSLLRSHEWHDALVRDISLLRAKQSRRQSKWQIRALNC